LEVNPALNNAPELVNSDPYGEGWMVKISISDFGQLTDLMDSAAYKSLLGV
jgi:glycine cleavage system H protein